MSREYTTPAHRQETTENNRKTMKDGRRRRSTEVISRSAGGQRSSGAVERSGVDSSSLPTLLLLEELTDVIRSHDLSENRQQSHDIRSHMISFLKHFNWVIHLLIRTLIDQWLRLNILQCNMSSGVQSAMTNQQPRRGYCCVRLSLY